MSFDPIDHDLERGLRRRRAILGDAWVDRSIGNANNFNAEFQAMITRSAWHDVWNRPGIDAKTRRVIVLAITLSLARWEEFDLHCRAALLGDEESRLSPDEIKEVLMQAAIYAGVPAANTAFSHTLQLLREVGEQIGYTLVPTAPASIPHPGTGAEGRSSTLPALHYSVRPPRSGKTARHTVVLSHALGCDLSMWDDLAHRLSADCRVIAYDHPGHGSSDAPAAGLTIAAMADGAAALLRELDSGPVVWIGLSMGGMVGQELALRHPSLVNALVLANTTSGYPEAARHAWQARIDAVKGGGLPAIADAVMERYFSADFRARQPATVARFRQRLLTTEATGYVACCGAVSGIDTVDRLPQLAVPALVIAGEQDQGTPVAMAQALADRLPDARLAVLAETSHLSAVEQSAAFAAQITQFLATL